MGAKEQLKVRIAFNRPQDAEVASVSEAPSQQDVAQRVESYGLTEHQADARTEANDARVEFDSPGSDGPSVQYEYHYWRILMAAIGLVVFFLFIAWGSVRLISNPEIAPSDHSLVGVAQTPNLQVSVDAEPAQASSSPVQPIERVPIESVMSEALETQEAPDSVLPSAVPESQPDVLTLADTATESSPSTARVNVEILKPDIVALARLAPNLQNRDPQGWVSSPMVLGPRSIVRLYFSTRLEGVAGNVYYHVWSLDGVEKARVPMRVASQNWRGNSSKYINRPQVGAWEASLVSGNGEVLARTAFEVRL